MTQRRFSDAVKEDMKLGGREPKEMEIDGLQTLKGAAERSATPPVSYQNTDGSDTVAKT